MKNTLFSALFFLLVSTQAHALLIESDFEDGVVGERANGPSGASFARTQTLYSDEQALSGTQSAKATINMGSGGSNDWGVDYTYPDIVEGEELWFRTWFFFPNDWLFTTGPKQTRIQTESAGGGNEGYFDFFFRESFVKMNSEVAAAFPAPPGCFNPSIPSLFLCNMGPEEKHVVDIDMNALRGTWIAIEMYVLFHATPGTGIYRTWLNGNLIFEDTDSPTLIASGSKSKRILIHTTWNNGAPQTQSDYFDDVVIVGGSETPSNTDSEGNSYIGTGNVTFKARPNPPIVGQ